MTIALTLLGISLLIIIHELGHYAVARACKMRVLRFSIGFGPAIWGKQAGETTWQVAAIPLGGFVQIQGMGPEDAAEPSDEHSFNRRPLWQRALVMLAGPGANWLTAAAALALLATSVGFHQVDESVSTLGDVLPDSAAARAGLQPGDTIAAVGDTRVSDWPSLVTEIRKHPGDVVNVELLRGSERLTLAVRPDRGDGGVGVLGVAAHANLVRYGVRDGVVAGVVGAARMSREQVSFLWGFATGRRAGRVSGLPGIIKAVSHEAQHGMGRLLEALALLSIGLFLFNLLPVPALDGGRLMFLGVEALRGKPVNQLVEGWVHAIGLMVLLAFMVFVSVRDLL
jgi:regulator of sigma E protease